MFQLHYFLLFTSIGFGVGFTNNVNKGLSKSPIDQLNPVLNLFAFAGVIWTLFTFGFFWAFITLGELFLGYFFGQAARK